MELVIKDKVYPLNFGMRFLRDINKKVEVPIEAGSAIKQKIGLKYYTSLLLDSDVEALNDVLVAANAGLTPNLTPNLVDSYFESTDIEEVFNDVIEGLEIANVTKKTVIQVKENLEKAKANQAQ